MGDNRIGDYKDLIVWKRAMEAAVGAYGAARALPKEETFALADQIRRSAISIPSNIAEGYGRNSTKEYGRFLSVARGSCYELETQMLLCVDLRYLTAEKCAPVLNLLRGVSKMLVAIMAKLDS